MLWGIPGALIGALLALRLGGWLLLVLGLVALALGVVLLRRGRTVYALPLLLGLLLLRGAALPQVNVVPGLYEVTGAVMDAPEQKRGETTVILDRVTLDGRRVPGALTLTVPFRADLAYGDALSLQARVTPDDRGAVQSLKTVLYAAQGAGEIIVRQGRADPLYGLALRWREKLGASADEYSFPIVALMFSYKPEFDLRHRDFLGSLMALGLRRDTIGDILCEKGRVVVFVRDDVADYVLTQVTQIGRVGVSITYADLTDLPVPDDIEELSFTLSSLRLDAFVAAVTNLSREKAARLIRSELVMIDHVVSTDVSKPLHEGATVTIRKYGKYVLSANSGLTRKGRLRVSVKHFR